MQAAGAAPASGMRVRYRADIDGLRCFAVLAVLLYHLQVPTFAGGYVGVDVFFVISGFLVTRMITWEWQSGQFSFRWFYLRRARRLFPGLFVTLAATFATASLVFAPHHLEDLGRSLVAASIFVSNVLFWRQSGYFDGASDTKPLLHTWSLGVEEQFYIIWPCFLVFAVLPHNEKVRSLILLGTLAVSLAACVSFQDQGTATFYLIPFRVFEFALGGLVLWVPNVRRTGIATLLYALGCVAVIGACVGFDEATVFPGYLAMLPCIGAAMMVLAGERTAAAFRGAVAIQVGRMSYSLYLCHWPIVVFYLYLTDPALDAVEQSALFVACMAMAYLMHRFVEEPFRRSALIVWAPGRFIVASIGLLVLLLVAALAAWKQDGWPWRSAQTEYGRLSDYQFNPKQYYRSGECFLEKSQAPDEIRSVCYEPPSDRPSILLLGDSHAAHLWYGMTEVFPKASILLYSGSACAPLLGWEHKSKRNCQPLMERFFAGVLPAQRYDLVILASEIDITASALWPVTRSILESNQQAYVIFGQTVRYKAPPVHLVRQFGRLAGAERHLADFLVNGPGEEHDDRSEPYFSVVSAFCPDSTVCQWIRNGTPLQWDVAHLTDEGSRLVAERFREWLFTPRVSLRSPARLLAAAGANEY